QFKSHYGWVPINEPGSGGVPKDAFAKAKFEEWKQLQPVAAYDSKGYEHFDFAEEKFLVDYNTWFLKWLTDEIHKHDPGSPVHVNNHAMFQLAAEYNFPEWRKFLTSLGGSAHASWHFGYFNRDQYAMAMSANSEIVRSGAGNIPWLMTELQGGTTTYSGYFPMTPTKEEISQWLWTSIGTESKGAIFWCLNARASGIEAGEWAMLDFQNNPSDRMQAAAAVANIINKNASLFADAKVAESGLNILYIREAMWVEKKLQAGNTFIEGRSVGGVMKSALAYFEALSEMGLQTNFKEIGEFDFSKSDYTRSTIILAHQISIPSRYWQNLYDFVSKGGKIIIDGLSGYYDENALCIMSTGFPLEKLYGGNISEYNMVDNLFNVTLTAPNLVLPAHLWRGAIVPTTGKPISKTNDEIIAVRNLYGKGEVLWIPSLVGLGGRITKDYSKLAALINAEAKQSIAPFRFQTLQPKMLMKTLQSGNSYITIVINKSKEKKNVLLDINRAMKPTKLFADKKGTVSNNSLNISPEETIVIQWK
ncbi:MAG: beta-galactosidase trimerization domain-containing protein, partial [Chitinophagaceae bacterium]